jgi:hypothetical protein
LFPRRKDHPCPQLASVFGNSSLWSDVVKQWIGVPFWYEECGKDVAWEVGFPALCEKWKRGGSFGGPIQVLFSLQECKCQLRPNTLFYCVKSGKRSLNYLQINCLLPLPAPGGPIRACVWKSWESAYHFIHSLKSFLPTPHPRQHPAKVICGCHFSWQTLML